MNKFILPLIVTAFTQLAVSQNSTSDGPWSVGGGFGPNFSRIDAVTDELNSSYGATLWLQRDFEQDYRLDLAVNYFDLQGTSRDYAGLSLAYGMRFLMVNIFRQLHC